MPTTTSYYKVVGTMLLPGGAMVRHFLEVVADYLGTPLPDGEGSDPTRVDSYDIPIANEQPRGTIVKIARTTNKTVTLNPTS